MLCDLRMANEQIARMDVSRAWQVFTLWALRALTTVVAFVFIWFVAILGINLFGPGRGLETFPVEIRAASPQEILTVTAITRASTGVPQTATARAATSTDVPQ